MGASAAEAGREMHRFMAELYPVCRSITGEGTRATLRRIGELIPVTTHEIPTGTQVFDWTVPKEWNVRDAYIADTGGHRLVDFRRSNLHVLNYSVPVRGRVSLETLKSHLFSLPEHPDWVPYRTSYYHESWGFCLSHNQLTGLTDDEYEVCIDSSLEDGHLTYGECFLPGSSTGEVLVSCHVCHPSLANDNLSGMALATFLAARLRVLPLRYSYRFLFIPGTIGSITWLSRNEAAVGRIKHGLVVACVGDPGRLTYKRSRRGNAEIDQVVPYVLALSGREHAVVDFTPFGYDERQYCSPAFDLPVGSLTRTPHGQYPEYHTSADNLDLVAPEFLADSLATCLRIVHLLEANKRYRNLYPRGEPQLGRRGLYEAIGGGAEAERKSGAMRWLLNLSDGSHSVLDIAARAGIPFDVLESAAALLQAHGVLEELASEPAGPAPHGSRDR